MGSQLAPFLSYVQPTCARVWMLTHLLASFIPLLHIACF